MHKIASLSELNRLGTTKGTPSTRSSSPPGGLALDSPTLQAGSLFPPPPAHYLRDKARTGGTPESITRLKKRSEIYERSRCSRIPCSLSLEREELPAQQEPKLSWGLRSASLNRGRVKSENLGDNSQTPDLTPWSFVATVPRSRSTGALRSSQDDVSSPLVLMGSSGPTVEIGYADPPSPSSPRGIRRSTRLHRVRQSDSSLSMLSNTSSGPFPLSIDNHIDQFPSTDVTLLPLYYNQPLSPNPRPHDCTPHNCTCNEKLHSPPLQPANALFDIQKRRRAQAFNQFTSYTEALPYHQSEQRTSNGDLGMDSIDASAARIAHGSHSELDLSEKADWEKQPRELSPRASSIPIDHISEKPRRKTGSKLLLGLRHILSPKASP